MRQTALKIEIHRSNLITKYSKHIGKIRFYVCNVNYLLK